jgi:hypothetical protein
MKKVLITALSILLLGNGPVLAADRNSAGAATPVKLGGGNRNKAATPAASQTQKTGGEAAESAGQTETAPAAEQKSGENKAGVKLPYGSFRGQSSSVPGQKTGFGPPGVTKTVKSVTSQTGVSVPETTKKTAFGGKGMIPPPPNVAAPLPLPVTGVEVKKGKKEAVVKVITVGSGGPFTFNGKAKEDFATNFNWQPDAGSDTLTFKANFTRVGGETPRFNWLRIMLGNQVLADERALKGKSDLTLDLTGKVDSGINQITMSGQGTAGATAEWKLTTPKKCVLRSVDPDEVLVGKDFKLKGLNFDPTPSKDIVSVGPKNLTPSTATATELKVRVPKDFPPGEYMVKVTIEGRSSHEVKLTIRGIPELTGTNLNGVPPGANLVIFGKNFSKKVNENVVLFDATQAQVVSCTTEQITVVVPNFENQMAGDTARLSGQVDIPIRVKVGKFDAINTVPINVGNSTWQDPGLKGGPDTPQVPVDWRRLLEN